ncbi:hypothetical protein NC651_024135 [Populus alba x Populus x berolinensis]|nr:hypothetical protein NC651_024135 [Populus alba x Populus x berolinensis]
MDKGKLSLSVAMAAPLRQPVSYGGCGSKIRNVGSFKTEKMRKQLHVGDGVHMARSVWTWYGHVGAGI